MANVKGSNSTNKMTVKPTGNPVTYSVRTDVNNNKIVTNASKETNTFAIKDNMSEYYARLSESFACGNGIINGVDYSSKYYASLSKEHAETAEEQKNAAIEAMDSFDSDVQTAKADIEQIRLNSIDSVNVLYDSILESVESARTNAIESLDQETENNKQEINALSDVIKDNADSIINRVGFNMFDTVLKDHVLSYEESRGLALQGTYVYKSAITGERYGYPDFYNQVLKEWSEATTTETVNGATVKVHANGHKFYSIEYKSKIDEFFNSTGTAWFYGLDTENERIFLPRNNWFEQMTGNVAEVGDSVEAGLPSISHTHTRGTMNITGSFGRFYTLAGTFSGAFYSDGSSGTGHGGSNQQNSNVYMDASRSWTGSTSTNSAVSSIYGKSDTVQPNSVKKLLYICVGNTVSDTSWVDVVTQVEGGVKDLEDKKNASIAEIDANAKSYDNLTKRQIANCLLEVPQNIKLELANGVLTLKAGSKVIVPNRAGVFKEVVTTQDKSITYTWSPVNSRQCMVFTNEIGDISNSYMRDISTCLSGPTTPTITNYTWYDTANNIVRTHLGTQQSFPIAIITQGSDGVTKSIDQVFNGFGYIGSHFWVDKGVKALAPNGKNTDGTHKNVEITTTKVSTYTRSLNGDIPLWLDVNGLSLSAGNAYDEIRNVVYVVGNEQTTMVRCQVAMTNLTGGKINSFQPKLPFRAVDYNDFNKSINTLSKAYITETYVNGNSWYRIWSADATGKRWCEQGGRASWGSAVTDVARLQVTLLKPYVDKNYSVFEMPIRTDMDGSANGLCAALLGVFDLQTTTFCLRAYCGGTNERLNIIQWQTCGYIE
jgi:hypothetical protein